MPAGFTFYKSALIERNLNPEVACYARLFQETTQTFKSPAVPQPSCGECEDMNDASDDPHRSVPESNSSFEMDRVMSASIEQRRGIGLQPEDDDFGRTLEALKPHDHLCLICDSREEWLAVVAPFISSGLTRREKCIHITYKTAADEIRNCLLSAGIDVALVEKSGQLLFLDQAEAYSREGIFDPDRIIALLIAEAGQAVSMGYPALRVTIEMTGILHGFPSPEKLLEFEAKLNQSLFSHYPCLAICRYDRRKYGPETIKGAMMTHSLLVKSGSICRNFYYMPPEEFLDPNRAEREVQHWLNNVEREWKTREELQQSEEKIKSIFRAAPVGIGMTVNRIIMASNDRLCEMTGYSREELLNSSARILYPAQEEFDYVGIEKYRQIAEKGTGAVETRWRRKDGEIIDVLLSSTPIDPSDLLKGVTFTALDITGRKRAIQEKEALLEHLRQSQKMEAIGQLAGGVAHDFNNILTIISGCSQLSLLDLREGDPLRKNLEEIIRATDRAADLTRQLLAFGRKQILEMRVLDLNQILQRLDTMLRRVIGEDIQLETAYTDPLGKVKVDPGQVEQVIMNLSVNARDAMPEGGKLTIETANVKLDEAYAHEHIAVKPGRYVMLAVSDTGKGMTKEVRERVFEPFFTTKEKGKGTGLGLSTVYGIVKQSGGNIWVYSEPGHGTSFKIYLPVVDDPLEEIREKAIQEIPRGSETILVVEDEEAVLDLAVKILKRQGYKVLEAQDGGKALLLCEEYKDAIQLILTDMVMPGINGSKLMGRLKVIHPEAKALYMSGYADDAIHQHGILEFGLHFLQKPFTVEALARKVREVLDTN
jgi:PAS domain S-box-containing protein